MAAINLDRYRRDFPSLRFERAGGMLELVMSNKGR